MKKKKFSNKLGAFIALLILGFPIFTFSKRILTDILVRENATHTKGVIIDERNYYPHQNVHPEFSYSYQFEINGHKYKGDCLDKTLHIGDSVEVKYNKIFPCYNKPAHPKD